MMPGPVSDRFRGPSDETPFVPTWMDDKHTQRRLTMDKDELVKAITDYCARKRAAFVARNRAALRARSPEGDGE